MMELQWGKVAVTVFVAVAVAVAVTVAVAITVAVVVAVAVAVAVAITVIMQLPPQRRQGIPPGRFARDPSTAAIVVLPLPPTIAVTVAVAAVS